jgi:hypothetical protein
MTLQGKGYFIWKIRDTEGGNVNAVAALAEQAKHTHLLLKIADGTYSYNLDLNTKVDLVAPLVQTLADRGIISWGWHYIYGDDPLGEANKAIQRIQETGVSGYVLDVEVEYKEPGKAAAAEIFMNRMRQAYPNLPMALSSYRFPSYHPQIPWEKFLSKVDYNMPQVYWQLAHNPGEQLIRCYNEFQALTPYRPIIPTGSAYQSGGWAPTPADVIEFMDTARSLNLAAANFWEWANTRLYLPPVWDAIGAYDWPTGPLPDDISQEYISALNTRDPEKVLTLYTPTAVHVTAARTVQGLDALRAWYTTLLGQLLPGAVFNLTGYSGTGSSRHFTWTAISSKGVVQNGSDTFGLLNGKITYHYSFFTITPA